MTAFLLVARLVLAGVFAGAGVAKLADRAGSRQAMVDFGLPASVANPLTILLPLAELAVAIALTPATTAWWGAVNMGGAYRESTNYLANVCHHVYRNCSGGLAHV